MCTVTEIHPFEQAGLGKAPFRYVGMVPQDISYGQRVIGSAGGVAITTKPGGTCDYCGSYIVNMFRVHSADGVEFKVGCDCIRKVDAKMVKLADAEIRKSKKEQKEAALKSRVAKALESLPRAYSLHNQPHPTPYRAEQGETLWQYAQWCLTQGWTDSAKSTGCRLVEAAIAPKSDLEA